LKLTAGCIAAVEVLRSAATKAMWSVMRQAQDRDVQHIGLRVILFKAMVLPVMLYGCKIRSLPFLKSQLPFGKFLQKVQNMFLRQIAGDWL
jgi:hypothetical protein